MPYAHILLCAYVLTRKSVHWHNLHVRRPYMYEARQALLSTEWSELTAAMLLWLWCQFATRVWFEWMNEWMNECMSEWMNGWMNELSTEYRNVSLTFRNFILKFSATSQEMVRGKSLDWIGQMEIWIYFPLFTPQFNSTWPYDASSIPIRELFQWPLSRPKNGPSRPKQTVNPNFGQTPIFFFHAPYSKNLQTHSLVRTFLWYLRGLANFVVAIGDITRCRPNINCKFKEYSRSIYF